MSYNRQKKHKKTQKCKENVRSMHILCNCGQQLTYVLVSDCYSGRGMYCNRCKKSMNPNEYAWHCLGEKNSMHSNGFDLCVNCYNMKS